jgi:hypothetical protein
LAGSGISKARISSLEIGAVICVRVAMDD